MPKLRVPNKCPHCGREWYTVFYTPSGFRCVKCWKSEFIR